MSSIPTVPQKASILIIGGGPGGSYAASLLQREGHQVVLMESSKFPRYHVGESMLPSFRSYLRIIELEDEFEKHGFIPKPGAAFKLVHGIPPSWNSFAALGPQFVTWNVIRSEMDELMLRHAERLGAKVIEETRVEAINFEGNPHDSRPISAEWVNKNGTKGTISFDWLIDASGRNGIISTKYLKNRVMRESLRNVAVWGYWQDVKRYEAGTPKESSGWFEALTDKSGWAWVIPLHDGTTSIGFVMHQNASIAKKTQVDENGLKKSLDKHYLDQFQFVPGVQELVGDKGSLIPGSIKSAADYSYFAQKYSGDHFRIIGDAANFIDPFFSSGVHIAMTGALSAVTTICASMNNQVDETLAQTWHDEKVGVAHTRFLFVVLSAYKVMGLQEVLTMADINEGNFHKAFEMFRPVMYGLADSDAENKISDIEVNNLLDTLQSYFDPLVDEEHVSAVKDRYGVSQFRLDAPVMGIDQINSLTKEDVEGARVMKKFDAIKVLGEESQAANMARKPFLGYRANMERGKFGLIKDE